MTSCWTSTPAASSLRPAPWRRWPRTQLYPAISRYLTEAAQAVKALGDIGKASRSQQDKLDCLISLLDSMDEDIVLLTDKIGRRMV